MHPVFLDCVIYIYITSVSRKPHTLVVPQDLCMIRFSANINPISLVSVQEAHNFLRGGVYVIVV